MITNSRSVGGHPTRGTGPKCQLRGRRVPLWSPRVRLPPGPSRVPRSGPYRRRLEQETTRGWTPPVDPNKQVLPVTHQRTSSRDTSRSLFPVILLWTPVPRPPCRTTRSVVIRDTYVSLEPPAKGFRVRVRMWEIGGRWGAVFFRVGPALFGSHFTWLSLERRGKWAKETLLPLAVTGPRRKPSFPFRLRESLREGTKGVDESTHSLGRLGRDGSAARELAGASRRRGARRRGGGGCKAPRRKR